MALSLACAKQLSASPALSLHVVSKLEGIFPQKLKHQKAYFLEKKKFLLHSHKNILGDIVANQRELAKHVANEGTLNSHCLTTHSDCETINTAVSLYNIQRYGGQQITGIYVCFCVYLRVSLSEERLNTIWFPLNNATKSTRYNFNRSSL